jgi:hypothetical protein
MHSIRWPQQIEPGAMSHLGAKAARLGEIIRRGLLALALLFIHKDAGGRRKVPTSAVD